MVGRSGRSVVWRRRQLLDLGVWSTALIHPAYIGVYVCVPHKLHESFFFECFFEAGTIYAFVRPARTSFNLRSERCMKF